MSITKILACASIVGLLLAALPAQSQGGLRMNNDARAPSPAWPHWQARFGLTTTSPVHATTNWQLTAGQLLGDYYWSGLRPAGVGRAGGFRATSGVLLGQRSLAIGVPTLGAASGVGLTLSRGPRLAFGGAEAQEAWAAAPYVGIGYSGVSLRGGWGFTADVGLAGTSAGLRARRESAPGTQGVDELLRELRLTPVLQFGASYAF